ncbi:MAG: hypothetical protein WCO55_03095 [Candidatus Falkowbacteria bacterium]
MQVTSEDRMRILIYAVVILVVAIGGGLFYLIWRDSQAATGVEVAGAETNKYSGIAIDNKVPNSPIFRELKPIAVPPEEATSTVAVGEITDAEVRAAKRRHSDPFVEFSY